MKNIAKYSTLAVVLASATPIQAQELQQQLDVQHTVTARHNDATRISQNPRLNLPAVTYAPLSYSEKSVSVKLPDAIPMLEPTAYADTLSVSPYNGYAAIGYFPAYNLAASAGYRILNNDRHRLNVWGQFDGNSYKDTRTINPFTGKSADRHIHRNTVTAGVSYHAMIARKSELDAGIDYTYARFNAPGRLSVSPDGLVDNSMYNQNVNRINFSTQWTSSVGGFHYTTGIAYKHFGYQKGYESLLLMPGFSPLPPYDKGAERPARENRFIINGAAALPLGDDNAVYAGINLDVINTTRRSVLSPMTNGTGFYTLSRGDAPFDNAVLAINPRYRLKNDNLTMSVGARIDFTFNSGKFFHIAPDINVSWTPVSRFTIWGKAGGGEHRNSLASLYDVNYMTMPMLAYKNSHIPYTLDAGIVAGPFSGAYAELYGGWAVANDWLMPTGYLNVGYGPSFFTPVNIKGWHAGLTLGYKYRSMADARIKLEAAPSDYDRGYYLWRDRAKYLISAEVNIHPIDRLDVGLAYSMRACRSMYDTRITTTGEGTITRHDRINLHNTSGLDINAAYRFTRSFTLFVNIDNILNRRASDLALLPTQGFAGLVGVSYKF